MTPKERTDYHINTVRIILTKVLESHLVKNYKPMAPLRDKELLTTPTISEVNGYD